MRVTEKGQVTIPRNVRRHLNISPGSEVEFSFVPEGALLRRTEERSEAHTPVQELADHIRRFKGAMDLGGMTSDEFFAMLRN